MTGIEAAANLPVWAAAIIAVLLLGGAVITLIGTLGLLKLPSFYQRLHAPTLGTSMGAGLVLLSSALFFSFTGGRPVVHEALAFIFVTVTTPVTLMLLARAALYRDRIEGSSEVPGTPNLDDIDQ